MQIKTIALTVTSSSLALLASTVSPQRVQATPLRLSCEAEIPQASGTSLLYRLTGMVPESTAKTPQSSGTKTLSLSVQRRMPSGELRPLLNPTLLRDDEQFPAVDFSQLPFTTRFRSQPQAGPRLYGVPSSVHGLYVSLESAPGPPQQMQILHFLEAGKLVRSQAAPCRAVAGAIPQSAPSPVLNSGGCSPKVTQTLVPLQQFLRSQDWAAADRETRRLLAPNSVSPSSSSSATPTAALIRAIDQAWLTASNERFGLSVQLRLWQVALAEHPQDPTAAVLAFRDRVGWTIPSPRPEPDFISSDWRNETELTYSLQAPAGHLPWAGVSDAVVQSVAIPPPEVHCGSCTVDAMQLRNERFFSYLPALFTQVQAAFSPPP
ncbi:GUN4 domain-containing protein [Lyngbya confervoides]|uniref:GUN4 domain-containing protein n=1 Tax=Lyngbya confervoides BDU141951 TaxID=1574623 RepID=A0ABD4T7B9_9CYAN|nr:GUN4 domain-containing protein [Lyngbya confervoides]MCM1984647.1 GUN4 domain-containing protein [Lyngbya confervoides BDU141951]